VFVQDADVGVVTQWALPVYRKDSLMKLGLGFDKEQRATIKTAYLETARWAPYLRGVTTTEQRNECFTKVNQQFSDATLRRLLEFLKIHIHGFGQEFESRVEFAHIACGEPDPLMQGEEGKSERVIGCFWGESTNGRVTFKRFPSWFMSIIVPGRSRSCLTKIPAILRSQVWR
jgi:hypothetical protein